MSLVLIFAEPRASALIRRILYEGKIPTTHQELNSDLILLNNALIVFILKNF